MPRCRYCPNKVVFSATDCSKCGAVFARPRFGPFESRHSEAGEWSLLPPIWLRYLIGLLSIGGGVLGVFFAVSAISTKQVLGGSVLLALAFCLMYMLGVWAGLLLVSGVSGWLRKSQMFWWLQVPVVSSPVISYAFAAGAKSDVYLQLLPLKFGANWYLGSSFSFTFFRSAPIAIGVNVIALVFTLYLMRIAKRNT